MTKPFKKIGFIGAAVLVMSIVLLFVFPSEAPWLMDGFFTPIIAFEFVETPGEVQQMFGPINSPERENMVGAMDSGNRLDYIYMVLYSLFLFTFSIQCARERKSGLFYIGAILAVVALAGDFLENRQLLGITSKLGSGDFGAELHYLNIFTWLKWGGLSMIFLILTAYFIKGNLYSKIVGLLGCLPFILAVLAWAHRSILNEIFALSLALMFVLSIVYCFTHTVRSDI